MGKKHASQYANFGSLLLTPPPTSFILYCFYTFYQYQLANININNWAVRIRRNMDTGYTVE